MRFDVFDRVTGEWCNETGGYLSHQANDLASRLPGIFGLTALSTLIAGPQIALAVLALTSASIRQSIIDAPMVALQLALALCFWIAIIIWPLRRAVMRLGRRRTVKIHGRSLTITDVTPFGTVTRAATLNSFAGIAHHIRSSMGVPRHELVLVHTSPASNVLLVTAEHISDDEFRRWQSRLGLPPLPAKSVYKITPKNAATDALGTALLCHADDVIGRAA